MTADAGCGKSVLSSFLVDHLRSEISELETPALVCHYFLKDSSAQGNATNALCAILNQIFTDSPNLLPHAFEGYESHGSAFLESFDVLWKILLSLLQDRIRKGIFLVLDGLDECGESTKSILIQSIVGLYKSLAQPWDPPRKGKRQGTVRELPFLKLFITSRPDNPIKAAFKDIPRLRGENEIEAISLDVNLVVGYSLEELSIPAYLKSSVQTKLINGADRTHLWTSLILNLLKDALINAVSESDIQSILNSRDIYDLYNHMLQRSSNPVQARLLLQILLAAARPLTLDEMNIALSITSSHQTLASVMSELKHPAENYIFSLCGHFIRVIRSEVYLVHQTAKELLVDDSMAQSHSSILASEWQNSISMKESNKALFTICMSGLAMFQTDVVPSDEVPKTTLYLFKESCVEYPLFEYAAQNWPNHFIAAEVDLESVFIAQNEHLCGTRYEGSYSCIEPYLRAWSGHADHEDFSKGRVRSELEAIALHILCNGTVGPNSMVRAGKTALHLAVISRSVALVKLLVGRKVPIDAMDFDGLSPLRLSLNTADENNAITKVLLQAGADVNAPDKDLRTALHHVADDGTADQIRLVSQATKANVRLRDRHGETPLNKIIRRPTMDSSAVGALWFPTD